MVSIWFEGVEELNTLATDIGTSPERVGARAAAVLRKSVEDGVALSMAFCPIDSGHLRSTISPEFRGDGRTGTMEGEWGPTASYGGFVEWGTSRTAPAAYIGPALDRIGPDFIEALTAINNPLA